MTRPGQQVRTLTVDHSRVDEFLMAVGQLPISVHGSGDTASAVPPGFLFYVSAFGIEKLHAEAGVAFDTGLFAGLRIKGTEPVRVGDELVVRASVGARRSHATSGLAFIEIDCEYERDGRIIVRETSTVARLASGGPRAGRPGPAAGTAASATAPGVPGTGHSGTGDGERWTSADRVQVAFMASAIRDPNPVHLDDDFARGLGLPKAILHGTFAIFHTVSAGSHGRWADVESFDVQMRSPIPVGERFRAEVTRASEQQSHVEARTPDGRLVAAADVAVRS